MSWLNRRLAATVALVLGVAGGPAAADELADGIEQYESLDYENAQNSLEAAVKDESLGQREIGKAAMYLGLVHYNLGNTVAAESYFGIALTFDDSLSLPPGTSPKIKKTFDEIRNLVFPVPRTVEGGGSVRPIDVKKDNDLGPPKWDDKDNDKPAGETKQGLPWWTIGSGTATAITGGFAIYYALESRATKNSIQDSPHSREQLSGLQDDLNTESTTANLLFAATGAFALSTAAFYLFEVRWGKNRERPVAVRAGATGSSAYVGARWQF